MSSLFKVTTILITLLAAGLASQAVAFLQQAGYLAAYATPLWDTSAWLPESGLVGRLLHTLVGYTDQPDSAQLFAYVTVIIGMLVLMQLQRRGQRQAMA